MNIGERDELIFKVILTYMRDKNEYFLGKKLTNVGFLDKEFNTLPNNFSSEILRKMSDNELSDFATSIGIGKSPASAKADVYINGEGVSLKSLSAAPAALVNHTARPGFEFACQQTKTSISKLDNIIEDYWEKRLSGIITEDTKISDSNCPFKNYKNYLKPIIEYFLFDGTGSRLSSAPAEYLIEFSNPFDSSTYRKLTKADAFDKVWPKLVFSLRSKKGMPQNYDLTSYNGKGAKSIALWVKDPSGNKNYKGALHIRATK